MSTQLGADATVDLTRGGDLTAAFLEAAFALCLGCKAFALLMRAGVIPARICEECDDIWSRRDPVAAG